MREQARQDRPVLVVGGGPAGLAAAVALARLGVGVLLVERKSEVLALPRATVVSTRSLEVLRSWGLQAAVVAGAAEVEWKMRMSETLAQVAEGMSYDVGFPSSDQSALISPVAPACVPQDHLEQVLLAHLRSLPAARVELGRELVGLAHEPDGVRAELRDVGGTATSSVSARYLVAADGAHSAVRRDLGIEMTGEEGALQGALVQFRAPLWDLVGSHRYGLYAVTRPDEAGGLFLPAGPDDRWLYGRTTDPARGGVPDPSPRDLARLIRAGAGIADLDVQVERIGKFTSAAQVAETWRAGKVFLVGDAAHRVTPRGGTGMNTALLGGYDLGWKLAWVLRGWATEALLDSYEEERRPAAEHNVARSADEAGSQRSARSELRADIGGRVAHHWLPGDDTTSTLDLLGPGLTLVTGPWPAAWEVAAAALPDPVPTEVRALDALTARALGVPVGGALLVRPDAAPAGLFARGNEAGLVSAVRSVTDPVPATGVAAAQEVA